ncbi:hypothetical protein CPB86DRAFT_821059 [Serendipita vermifera]|nr:hypothetical protein CPB86DRAFT_821059 [Serendipita vermifera]
MSSRALLKANMTVTVKVIQLVASSEFMKRKLRCESTTWGVLQHRNIVPLYSHCKEFGVYGSLIHMDRRH